MKRFKKLSKVFFLVSGFLLLLGCREGKKNGAPIYQEVVDDYAEILLEMDQDSAKYDQALESVGKYLDQPDPGTLKEARAILNDTVKQLEEEKHAWKAYEMEEDFQKQLERLGIEEEEYLDYADSRLYGLEEYIGYIQFLDQLLEYEETGGTASQELEFQYKHMLESQRIMRECSFVEVNYWFAGQKEEVVDYVTEKVWNRLESYHTETPIWDDDREAVERRINVLLDEYEALVEEQARHLGEETEKLYREEEQMK